MKININGNYNINNIQYLLSNLQHDDSLICGNTIFLQNNKKVYISYLYLNYND